MTHAKGIGITGVCPHCGEAVEVVLTKRQIKQILKGFKASTPAQADLYIEAAIGRDKRGQFKD